MDTAAVRLEGFSYAWPGACDWTLREIRLVLERGECHCLTGATGSGKTTLALALKDLLPSGRKEGRLHQTMIPGDARAAVGLIMQNPETQVLTESVGAEVAFGLENLCVAPELMQSLVADALGAVGLELPPEYPTSRLSMGQKYRLLVAAQLVLEPALLILDEPAGQLDAVGLNSLAVIISRLKQRGLAVLLCEHNPGPLASVIDRHCHLDGDGRLRMGQVSQPTLDAPGERVPPDGQLAVDAAPVDVQQLAVAATDAAPAWDAVNLVLKQGERILFRAANGAGKTTLLRCLAGFLRPSRGEVRVFGAPPVPQRLRGRAGFLFQNPRRQLFETTVFDELAFTLWRLGMPAGKRDERVRQTLKCCGIAHLSGRSPHQLSYGQQHLVALAAVLAPKPELLLLDDPLAGLDPVAQATVSKALAADSEARGTSIFWTSHRDAPAAWCHRTLCIEGGRLVPG
jgi:energy-coupling factor transport system ATP-binding protein